MFPSAMKSRPVGANCCLMLRQWARANGGIKWFPSATRSARSRIL
jgi:hypothetical protein